MTRPLLTEADLSAPGPALRLRDIMQITGFSRNTLRAEMDCGRLVGFRNLNRPGSCWLFKRHVVAAWWAEKQQLDVAC